MKQIQPYVTGWVGSFTTETIARQDLVGARLEERDRRTDFATNVGGGFAYRLTDWLGAKADYRTFFVHRPDDNRAVHRFTTGLTFRIR